MTSRKRLQKVLSGEIPDCVPVCPDISNMVPARLTGKPFWDIYAYQDPPLWKAYIDAVKYYDIDGGFEVYSYGNPFAEPEPIKTVEERIVHRNQDGSFVTQIYSLKDETWHKYVSVYTADNPPASNVLPANINLPPVPLEWEPIKGVKQWPTGMELWKLVRGEMGDRGVLGVRSGCTTCMLTTPEDVYEYYDNPKRFINKREFMLENVQVQMERIAASDMKPDFVFCGGSGTLVWQTPEIFRELALPVLKKVTEMAFDLGLPTHIHSCGPEAELVKMAALETKLTIIDPLEVPPMGDCNLAELKKLYGDKIVLKGNLHTTKVMLNGSVDDVIEASKKAIDDAATGGGFILSTGDQCGRDTPDENIRAMVETARTYGKY